AMHNYHGANDHLPGNLRLSATNTVRVRWTTYLLSYFEHRLVLDPADLTADVPLAGDQLAVARSLVTLAQSHPGGDLGIVVTGPESSGVTRTITYSPADLKPVADALRDLANADDGLDFTVDVRYGESGDPERFLRLGFPRLGQPGAPYVWEYGANLIDFTWPSDAASMATRVLGPGGAPVAADPTALAAGWPLLEAQVSPTDTTDAAMLDAQVAGELAARRRPVVLPELTVRADLDPVVGGYSVGDDARIVIDDPFFAGEQLDVTVRILGLEVTPGDDAGQEQVKLTVAPFLEPS
ncbi:hypothetical protein, partial [Actinophytocola sp.]|uniref:hypothetical protein n=1 Tax=Actinophytocola sp. TaxID=1872138 RepID=UPI00389984AD